MRYKPTISLFLFFLSSSILSGQWMDPHTIQTTVLIEKVYPDSFVTHGTGFLMYNYELNNKLIVVTCAHLVKGKKKLSIRVNPDSTFSSKLNEMEKKGKQLENIIISENSIRFITLLDSTNLYIHPSLDIAAFYINVPILIRKTDTGSFPVKPVDLRSIAKSHLKFRKDVNLGDEVYFLGFPLGLGVSDFVEPIVRSGSVAWIPKSSEIFLLDAFSYGGNSGSPIFQKDIIGSDRGDLGWPGTKLVGMVIGHQKTIQENILFLPNPDELKYEITNVELNIGLARCVYTDDIVFTINKLKEKTGVKN